MSRGRVVFLVIVALLVLRFGLHHLFVFGPMDKGFDFQVFERASLAPAHLVYEFQQYPFAYPPPALLLMKPLTAYGYWPWMIVSALAFAFSVAAVTSKRIAALSFFSLSAIRGLIQGQTAMLLSAMLFAGLRLPPVLGGIVWGIAASIKPQLMLFAPVALLVRKDWHMLGGMVLGGLLMVAASLVFLDAALWAYWIEALPLFNRLVTDGAMVRAITPAGIAAVAGLPTAPFIVSGLALGLAAVMAAAKKAEGEYLVGLIVAASLVASPYANIYDAAALIPVCVAMMWRGHWAAAIPAAMIFIGLPLMTTTGMMFGLILAASFALNDERQLNPL